MAIQVLSHKSTVSDIVHLFRAKTKGWYCSMNSDFQIVKFQNFSSNSHPFALQAVTVCHIINAFLQFLSDSILAGIWKSTGLTNNHQSLYTILTQDTRALILLYLSYFLFSWYSSCLFFLTACLFLFFQDSQLSDMPFTFILTVHGRDAQYIWRTCT